MKKSLMSLVIISGLLVGCQDEERDPFPFEKQVELLAGKEGGSKSWSLESLKVNGTNASIDECDKDNIFTFYNNDLQEYAITAGAQKCDPSEHDVLEEGAWMFATDGKTLIVAGSKIYEFKTMNYFGLISSKQEKILELTETNFKAEINVVDGVNSESANIIISLKAK
jgi:hypothetical protein